MADTHDAPCGLWQNQSSFVIKYETVKSERVLDSYSLVKDPGVFYRLDDDVIVSSGILSGLVLRGVDASLLT